MNVKQFFEMLACAFLMNLNNFADRKDTSKNLADYLYQKSLA